MKCLTDNNPQWSTHWCHCTWHACLLNLQTIWTTQVGGREAWQNPDGITQQFGSLNVLPVIAVYSVCQQCMA